MDAQLYERRPSLAFALPATIGTLGLYLLWFGKARATLYPDRLRLQRGIFHRQDEVIPLSRITSIKSRQQVWPGTSMVIIGTGSGETSGVVAHLNRRHARKLSKRINDARTAAFPSADGQA